MKFQVRGHHWNLYWPQVVYYRPGWEEADVQDGMTGFICAIK